MAYDLATRTFTAVGSDSEADRTIFSGSGILLSIIISNTSGALTVNLISDEDGTTLFQIITPANSSKDWDLGGGVVLDNGAVFSGGGATNRLSAVWRPQ